ncbi:MAG TPA: PorV/PorQ family protein [Gemmatimonadaceae bacterium]|nr:PorV/PorQ family protein [Gemmatimonadaceae bacterium]
MRRIAILAAVAACLISPRARAQASGSSVPLLELPASTRALALGNAFVAAGKDEASIFYNPAQLATIDKLSAGLSVQQWFLGQTVAAAAAAVHAFHGTAAIGLQVLDYGSSERAFDDGGGLGEPTGAEISAGDYVASIAYGVSISRLRIGATGKYVNQRLVDESGGTGAVDFGAALDVKGVTLAASMQNVGGEISLAGDRRSLPQLVRVGAAVPVHGVGPVDLLGTIELTHMDGETKPFGGVEVQYQAPGGVTILGRVGALDRPTGADISPVAFGGGVRALHFALDYAYEGSAVFGAMHRVGVRWWR